MVVCNTIQNCLRKCLYPFQRRINHSFLWADIAIRTLAEISLSLREHLKAAAVNRPRRAAAEQEPWRSSRSDRLRAKFVRPGFPSRVNGALFHWWTTTVAFAWKFHAESRGVRNVQTRSWPSGEFAKIEKRRKGGRERGSATERTTPKLTLSCHGRYLLNWLCVHTHRRSLYGQRAVNR